MLVIDRLAKALWSIVINLSLLLHKTINLTVHSCALAIAGCCLFANCVTAQDIPSPLSGYLSFTDLEASLRELDESPWAKLSSLGETGGKRSIWLLTVAADVNQIRPAILILGNVSGSHVVGRELAHRMAHHIVNQAASEPALAEWLSRFTLYFIPSPTPDATEKNFLFPVREHVGNLTPTDDDRDFEVGEDPTSDLNHDGWVTMMRVEEEFGGHRTHPKDPRVLIPVDETKKEVGQYRLLPESLDSDQDESFGEDSSDGVDFNRNFPFNYQYFSKSAGPHQVSEKESRAVADFMFDHPEITFVFCFSPEDNLFHPWKGSEQSDAASIKSKVLTEDQRVLECLANLYQQHHAGLEAPEPSTGEGSFSQWSYFHFGRWTFSARGWWIPRVEKEPIKEEAKSSDTSETQSVEAAAESAPSEDSTPVVSLTENAQERVQTDRPTTEEIRPDEPSESQPPEHPTDSPPSDAAPQIAAKVEACEQQNLADLDKNDKRGEDLLNALDWFSQQGLPGFADWQTFEHPGFPGKKVEIGGFKPLMLLNPPASLIEPLVKPHVEFLKELTDHWPKIEIRDVQADRLGPGLYDIRCRIVNTGPIPTMPLMGQTNDQWYPIQVQIRDTAGARWIKGSPRQSVGRLKERGGSQDLQWVFLLPEHRESHVKEGDASRYPVFTIQAVAPTLHTAQSNVEVTEVQE